jgi:hypothetical protein
MKDGALVEIITSKNPAGVREMILLEKGFDASAGRKTHNLNRPKLKPRETHAIHL